MLYTRFDNNSGAYLHGIKYIQGAVFDRDRRLFSALNKFKYFATF